MLGLYILTSCITTSRVPNKICYNYDVYIDSALNIIDTYTCEEGGYIFDYEQVREVENFHMRMETR